MNRKTSIILGFFVIITLLFVALNIYYGFRILNRSEDTAQASMSFQIPPFQFTNQEGKNFGTEQLQNKMWVANFIFTRCPGPCLQMTKKMAELQKKLGANSPIQLVSFTVDPDYDQAPVMKAYGQSNGANWNQWTFVTGSRAEMHGFIEKGFKLSVAEATPEEEPDSGPFIHSTMFVVVGPDGKTLGYIDGADPDFILRMEKLLKRLSGKAS